MLALKPLEKDKRWLWLALGLIAAGLVGWGVMSMLGKSKGPKAKAPVKAFLVPDKPPPPPPKEEKKPEPPKNEAKEIKMNTPQTPAPVAQNEPLKMEGAAGEGSSPFGGGSVTQEGVRGGMGGGLYGSQVQKHLQGELNKNRKLKESDYRVTLQIWIGRDGSILRAELVDSTGIEVLDSLLKQSLLKVAAMSSAPPENMPQPLRIKVTARGAS